MKNYAVRLNRGQDVKNSILKFVKENDMSAAVMICSVGSLSKVCFRLPVQEGKKIEVFTLEEEMEIISINGRVSANGHAHLHISICDRKGCVFGGHLLDGCIVRTTLEIVILDLEDKRFITEVDDETGFDELVIKKVLD